MNHDYSRDEIISALKGLGAQKGDNLFMHSNMGFFGRLKDAASQEDYYRIFKESILEVIGSEGTMVVPVFSYSFCKGNVFDIDETPGGCGFFSEMLRKDPSSSRSADANFSVAALGANASYFTSDAPEHSFGKGSFWDKFLKKKGKICNFNFDAGSTFVHYVEKSICVNYRYDKAFKGISKSNNVEKEQVFYHFVYDLGKSGDTPEFTKFHKKAVETGMAKTANLGRGQILLISAEDTFKLIEAEIPGNPMFLRKGND
ncbi:MAG: AAC(3) family N-acetyltransferase [Lentisphaerae bacterium]|nr:AAC(3) family N-acetyltransferase [Lentisphaerota bacterium]